MDEILLLPGLVEDKTIRRILHARSLVTPVGNKHVYSYTKIALMLHSDPRGISYLYNKGLGLIVKKISAEKAHAIRTSFASLTK